MTEATIENNLLRAACDRIVETLSPAQAEAIEAEVMYQYEAGASARDRQVLGITTHRAGGGVVLSARTDPSHYWSKALGFGFDEPITRDLVDGILDIYRAEDNKFAVLQIAPDALPAEWEEIRQALNLREGGALIKYAAPIDDLTLPSATDLRIAPVTEKDAEAWGAILQESFGFPEEGSRGLFAASVANPQFHPYGAWDGDTLVGGGNLFVKDGIASLNAGAVSSAHRRLGAQSALIAARIAKARELGCRWVTAETFHRPEGESDSSMNNMLRAGLKVIYVRQSWIWESVE